MEALKTLEVIITLPVGKSKVIPKSGAIKAWMADEIDVKKCFDKHLILLKAKVNK